MQEVIVQQTYKAEAIQVGPYRAQRAQLFASANNLGEMDVRKERNLPTPQFLNPKDTHY
jgi:hypothetical protein